MQQERPEALPSLRDLPWPQRSLKASSLPLLEHNPRVCVPFHSSAGDWLLTGGEEKQSLSDQQVLSLPRRGPGLDFSPSNAHGDTEQQKPKGLKNRSSHSERGVRSSLGHRGQVLRLLHVQEHAIHTEGCHTHTSVYTGVQCVHKYTQLNVLTDIPNTHIG